MYNLKLNEQIAFLRRQKGMTQEELAKILGVTNQSVSKWESSQCCPDIQLLPEIAKIFGVSIDELMGYKAADTSKDMILQLKNRIDSLPKGEDFSYTLKMAYALHAVILSKCMTAPSTGNPGWDSDGAVEHAGEGEWGYSCVNLPEITTLMRTDSVFYSGNKNLRLNNKRMREISDVMKVFGDLKNFRIMSALYELTVLDEDAYVPLNEIIIKCELPDAEVKPRIEDNLSSFLSEKYRGGVKVYRIDGMYIHFVPIMCMFSAK